MSASMRAEKIVNFIQSCEPGSKPLFSSKLAETMVELIIEEFEDWRLIETVPDEIKRDGTEILLWCPNDVPNIVVGRWFSEKDWGGLLYADEALSDLAPEGPVATHWMPQMDPPQ